MACTRSAREAAPDSRWLHYDGPWQWFFLAMAHWQLGEKEKARKWFNESVQWMEKNQLDKYRSDPGLSYGGPGVPDKEDLRRFRTEAAATPGVGAATL